jgi:hypothetical protein
MQVQFNREYDTHKIPFDMPTEVSCKQVPLLLMKLLCYAEYSYSFALDSSCALYSSCVYKHGRDYTVRAITSDCSFLQLCCCIGIILRLQTVSHSIVLQYAMLMCRASAGYNKRRGADGLL